MKKLIYIFLICSIYGNAQVDTQTSQSNFYNYLDLYSKANGDSIPDKHTQRLAKLWMPRLSPDGDFKKASAAIYNYAQNYDIYNTSTYQPNWTNLGPIGTSNTGQVQNGQIHNFIFDPNYGINNNQTIYACSSYGGLWRSENDGDLWSMVNTDIGIPLSRVADMAIHPNNSNTLFIASGESDAGVQNFIASSKLNPIFSIGVYRSTDYGETWHPINSGLETSLHNRNNIREIEINPNNPNQLFIATEDGVFRTNNANDTTPVWSEVLNGLNGNIDREFKGLEFKPNDSNTIYASGKDIYKSINGGNTWVSMTGTGTGLNLSNLPNNFSINRINITSTPAAPEKLYAYMHGYNDNGSHAYLYIFDGQSWSMLRSYHPTSERYAVHWSRLAIAAHPTNPNLIFFGDTQIWSIDANTLSVTNLSNYYLGETQGIHSDVHSIEFPPNDDSRFFCGTDGGISLKTEPFTNMYQWTAKNNGLSVSLIWTFDDSDYNDHFVLAGFQDNGTRRLLSNNDWLYIGSCDGYAAQINDTDDTNAFFKSCGLLYRYNYITNHWAVEVNGRATESVVHTIDYRPYDPSSHNYRLWLPNDFEIKTEPTSGDQYWTYTEIEKRLKKIPDTQDQTNPDNLWELKSNISTLEPFEWRRQLTRFEISEANPNYRYTINVNFYNYFTPPLTPKLYKVTDGSNNYSISNLPNAGPVSPVITDIVIDPTNPQRIWITYSSFFEDYKVWLSEDAGETWTNADPNHSLPNLPLNAITYQKGTNDILYVATDAGVYVKNGTQSDWEKYGDCPNVIVQDLKINYCSNKLKIATYGRGMWEADLLPYAKDLPEIIIDTDITWDTDVKRGMLNNIRIENGATLTLKGELSMPQEGKIIIKKGGKFIIDGGEINQNCGGLWQGVIVRGDSNHPNNSTYQGELILKNGATIKNALYAIQLGTRENGEYIPGGKLTMINATLKNNVGAIKIYSPITAPNPNQISIRQSTFITNDDLYENLYPKNFIFISSAKNVIVDNNTFTNDAIFSEQTAFVYNKTRGTGIYSFHSKLHANNNTFENLYGGIKINETLSNFTTVDIKSNSFIKNFNAVLLNNSSATVTSNDINIYGSLPSSVLMESSSGIYIVNSKGFHIEDNDIYAETPSTRTNGLFIRDCGTSNIIYRNRFDWLETAIFALGINTYHDTNQGIQIQCNAFNNNKTDVYVAPNSTIATLQGSKNLSSGNTFNPLCDGGHSIKEFNNQSSSQINYFGDIEDPQYMPYCNFNTNVFHATHNDCPSKLGGLSGSISALNSSINTNKVTLTAITDGGDTQGLNETVDETETDEAILLRNKLLEKSPSLSDTVMVNSTTKETILPAIMLKQVLAANPKAAKSDKVQKALDNRENKLPDYMRSEIDLGKNNLSYKEEIESNLSKDINYKENLINTKINNYLRDTISPTTADIEITNILSNEALTNIDRNYDLAEYYISKNDIQNAENIFNSIPQNFALTSNQQEKYNKLVQLFNINKDVINNNKSWFDLDSAQLNTIHNLSIDSTSSAGMQARAILSLIEEKDYGYPIPFKVGGNKNSYHAVIPSPKFDVFPKEAVNYFVIDYVLNDKENIEDVEFSIYDNFEKKITDKVIITKQNQLIIECDKWQEGIYWCKKIVNNFPVDKKQILILRKKSEEDFNKYFDVYPNPTDKFFNIKLSKNSYTNINIQITDIRGVTIKNIKLENNSSDLNINTSNWQSGVYFVSLFNNDNLIETIKLIIK